MSFSHPYGSYNVEGSFNDWVRVNLTAAGLPTWMPSARLLFDWPESYLISGHSGHAFTVTHLGKPETIQRYQGRNTISGSAGQTVMNLAQVDGWISKQQAGAAYNQRLRQMGGMIEYLFTSGREIEIKNLYTSTAAPSGIKALIRLNPAQGQTIPNPDPINPDYFRVRYLVSYNWLERV